MNSKIHSKFGTCDICYEEKTLINICRNDHFCCIKCLIKIGADSTRCFMCRSIRIKFSQCMVFFLKKKIKILIDNDPLIEIPIVFVNSRLLDEVENYLGYEFCKE